MDSGKRTERVGGKPSWARYEVPSLSQEKLGLWVRGVGYSLQQKSKEPMNRVLGSFAAVLVTRGRGWFESSPTGRVVIRPGHLFWLFPTVRHSYSPDPGTTWTEQWVVFGGSMAAEWERQGFLEPSQPLVIVGDDEEVAGLFERIGDVFSQEGPLSVPLAASLVHQLVVVVHGLATGLLGRGELDPVVAEALRIIQLEAVKGLRPEDLARRLHMGYSTLRRQFKALTGFSIKEFILSVRLKRAKEKLVFTRLSVEQVAFACGFQDPFYFSRLFQKREGVAPSTFRALEAASRSVELRDK